MYKIIIPKSNPNDEFVFIAEWKFDNNDFVKKGDHILSIETSKVIEEIFSENEGYLEKFYEADSKINVGEVVGLLNKKKNKKSVITKTNKDNTIFTKKAKKLLEEHQLDEKIFLNKNIVNEKDVFNYLNSRNANLLKKKDQLIILFKSNKPYHAAIYINNMGIYDLSLLGSKLTSPQEYKFPDCKCIFFEINLFNKNKLISFFNEPAILTNKIIKKEKSLKGWAMTSESADFILRYRNVRSKNSQDMNCIEWLIYGLELGGINMPMNILTASQLFEWAKKNLSVITKDKNENFFSSFY